MDHAKSLFEMLGKFFKVVFLFRRKLPELRPVFQRDLFFPGTAAPFVTNDLPIVHPNDPFSRVPDILIMRHKHDSHPLPMKSFEDLQDLRSRPGIKIPRGFVSEDHQGLVDKRPRDRHALLLPSRKLVGTVSDPVGKPDFFEHFLRSFEITGTILRVKQRKTNILQSG